MMQMHHFGSRRYWETQDLQANGKAGETGGKGWNRFYLWKPEQVGAAIHYVVRERGEPMAAWEKPQT